MEEKWKNLLLALIPSSIVTGYLAFGVYRVVKALTTKTAFTEMIGGTGYDDPIVQMLLIHSALMLTVVFSICMIVSYFAIKYLRKRMKN